MKGTYRFYSGGRLVGEHDNVITTLGKQSILRYLVSQSTTYYGGLAIGSGNSTPVVGNTDLDFEYMRSPISYANVNYATNDIVYKATVGAGLAGRIYECGLFSQQVNQASGIYSSKLLATFDTNEPWTNNGTTDNVNNRIGVSAIQDNITVASTTVSHVNLAHQYDLSGYSALDQFGLAFITYSDYVASITVTFTNTSGVNMTGTFAPATHTAGLGLPQYQIIKVNQSAFTNPGADWSTISSMTVAVTSKATASGTNYARVTLDGIRVFDTDTVNPEYVLISRSTASGLVIPANQNLDIEYTIRFNL